jgi:hypothetical protein
MPDDRAARLEYHGQAQALELGQDRRRVLRRRQERLPFVPDPQAAAQIDVLERAAVVAEFEGQRDERARRPRERLRGGDLRSDVNMDADKPQARHAAARGVDAARVFDRHAEFVGLESGGDVFGWLRASISGLTRRATRATRRRRSASPAIRSNSPEDSALIVPTPAEMASSIS